MNTSSTQKLRWTTTIGVILTICLFIAYFLYIRTNKSLILFESIRHLGVFGIFVAIVVLALFCVLPVPSEFLIVMNMEIYGAGWGIFYSWLGGIIGAVAAYLISNWAARPLIQQIAGRYLTQIHNWMKPRGSFGLLLVRFVPFLPYHLVNYIAGVLRLNVWSFTWTTALGLIPFDLAMAGMFSGFRHGTLITGISGGALLILLLGIGFLFRKKLSPIESEAMK